MRPLLALLLAGCLAAAESPGALAAGLNAACERALWGDPLQEGLWPPAWSEARALAARLAPLAGDDPALNAALLRLDALEGRCRTVENRLDALPALAADPAGLALRAWCRRDWRLLDGRKELSAWERVVQVRALVQSGYEPEALALCEAGGVATPFAAWSLFFASADPTLCGPARLGLWRSAGLGVAPWPEDPAGVLALDARLAEQEGAGDGSARLLRLRLRLALSLLTCDRLSSAFSLDYVASDLPLRELPACLPRLAALPPPEALGSAPAGSPISLSRRSLRKLKPAQQELLVPDLVTTWRKQRGQGFTGIAGLLGLLRRNGSGLRLAGEVEAWLAEDPFALVAHGLAEEAFRPEIWPDFARVAWRSAWRDPQVDTDAGEGPWPGLGLSDRFAVRWRGLITIPVAGRYRFSTRSDDGSVLRIDGEAVVDNRGMHGAEQVGGQVDLSSGEHTLELDYFDLQWGARCHLRWRPPGADTDQVVPATVLRGPDGSPGLLATGGVIPADDAGASVHPCRRGGPPVSWSQTATGMILTDRIGLTKSEKARWMVALTAACPGHPWFTSSLGEGIQPHLLQSELIQAAAANARSRRWLPRYASLVQWSEQPDPAGIDAWLAELASSYEWAEVHQAFELLRHAGRWSDILALAEREEPRFRCPNPVWWRCLALLHLGRPETEAAALSLIAHLPDERLPRAPVPLVAALADRGHAAAAIRCLGGGRIPSRGLTLCWLHLLAAEPESALACSQGAFLPKSRFAVTEGESLARAWLAGTCLARLAGRPPPAPGLGGALVRLDGLPDRLRADLQALVAPGSAEPDGLVAGLLALAELRLPEAEAAFAQAAADPDLPLAAAGRNWLRWLAAAGRDGVLALRQRPLAPPPGPGDQ